ncbi:hypothetical protein ANCDUO_19355 [Ancylostoma duodenale]|uniref:Uncharacterized protein n=1 Tax=Ancylostoma duodenale TaxID=51022 RepID=A0A0C2G0F2_9BILA|nr:hypothetical protein ANCDUO_19355 [Ancylostoma duodenale]
MGTEEKRPEIAKLFHDREYESKESQISRLTNVHKEEEINLDNMLVSLAILSDGSKFRQF